MGIFHGKMVLMNATVEMDKAGRLVVPKKMRDALHLCAGDRLSMVLDGEKLILAADRGRRGMYRDRGWLVYDSGVPMEDDHAVRQIEDARNARMAYLSGETDEP
jgi:AbrB family looped-hinge helix DNA binding protein